MKPQVDAVRRALSKRNDWNGLPITPALLFMSVDNRPLLSPNPLRFGEVYVLGGKALGKLVRAAGRDVLLDVAEVERVLATARQAT